MDDQDLDDVVTCFDCDAPISPATDTVFGLGDAMFLCASCACARGGVYDAKEDRWTVYPRSTDLPDERRAHT